MKSITHFRNLLFLILLFPSFALSARKIPLLFVFYDAGETLAFQPVLKQLDHDHVEYRALVMATSRNLFPSSKEVIDLVKDCGVSKEINDGQWTQERSLGLEDLSKVKNCVSPKILVSGMISEAQRQIALTFKNSSKTIGYSDSLSYIEPETFTSKYLSSFSEIWMPSSLQVTQFRKLYPQIPVIAVGQPTTEVWGFEKIDKAAIIKELPKYNKNLKTILYAGGYGDDYYKAFELFVKATLDQKNYNIFVSLHPKGDGSIERRILAKYKSNPILILSKSLKTREVAMLADVIVSQSSTVGTQAVFMKKRSIFFDVPGSKYSAFVIDSGLAERVSSEQDFKSSLAQSFSGDSNLDYSEVLKQLGLPAHSTLIISKLLKKKINSL